MRNRLEPYPQYYKTRLTWIEKIPSDWKILRAKNIFNPIDIRSESGQEELLSVSEKFGVTPRKQVNVTMFKAESYQGYKLCWPGDLVINSLWAWMQGLGFSKHHGIISSAYGVYRIKDHIASDFKYFDYLLRSNVYLWELRVNSKGIWRSRYQLTDESFFTIPILLPPENDRKQIARYLDWKTSQISKYIKVKKRMIELLKEQKQVIINDAVTGKIDVRTGRPYPIYKDSGVEWLGKVPEKWEVRKLKHIAKLKSGDGITSEKIADTGDYRVFGGNGIRGYTTSFTHEGSYVLIGRQGALCGNINYADGKFWASEHAVVVNPINITDTLWLGEALRTMNLNQYSIAAAQPGLSVERIINLVMPFPPLSDQQAISNYISKEISRLNYLTSSLLNEISLFQEYHTRLITDVVTGKIDVRDIVVPEFENASDVIYEETDENDIEEIEEQAVNE